MMGAEGRMVRGRPRGAWTSRHHTWESARLWWPDGIPALTPAEARIRLVEAYLGALRAGHRGRRRLVDRLVAAPDPDGDRRCGHDAVDADRRPGLVLAGDDGTGPGPAPVAALLPALDPDPDGLEAAGLVPAPPTTPPCTTATATSGRRSWWDGEVIGGWAVRRDGSIAYRLLIDRGDGGRRRRSTRRGRTAGRGWAGRPWCRLSRPRWSGSCAPAEARRSRRRGYRGWRQWCNQPASSGVARV